MQLNLSDAFSQASKGDKEGGFYLDDKVLAVSFKVDHDRFVVNRLPVPRSCDLKLLTPFLWHPLANLELNGIKQSRKG